MPSKGGGGGWEQRLHQVNYAYPNSLQCHTQWFLKWFQYFNMKIEPRHDKTNKMICAPSEDSDQPGHPPSLIRVSAVRLKQNWDLSYSLSAQRKLTESAAMGFSMVCVMLQAVYTTAEKEFRTIVLLFFYASCWHKKAPIRHKRWNNMTVHPVHYKGKGLKSRGLF